MKRVKKTKRPTNYFTLVLLIAFSTALALLLIVIISKKPGSGLKNTVQAKVAPVVVKKPVALVKKVAANSAATIPQNYGRSVSVPILMYHYIGNNPNSADKARDVLSTAPDKFDEQMGYLAKNGFNPITFDTLYSALKGTGGLPSKPIILTFDDGYTDFYINAYPILQKNGFKAVSFIPTGLMNQGYYLTWDQIKEMDSGGLIQFEAHTINHLNLATLSPDQMKYQIVEGKKQLEEHLGHPVGFFAYPYGVSNAVAWQIVKEAGFLAAVGTWYGTVESEGNLVNMPRIRISGGLSLDEFAKRI